MPAGFQAFGSAAGYVGSHAFSPVDLPNLQLWLRSDLGVTLVSGNVSVWADQSGNGDANRNVTQGTAGARPVYTASDANYAGQPSLKGATAVRYLASGVWAVPIVQPTTIFIAGTLAGSGRIIDGSTGGGGREACLASTAKWSIYSGAAIVEGATASSLRKVVALEFNGASSKIFVTDPTTPEATGNPGTDGISRMGILNTQDGAAGATDAEVVEIIVLSGIATADERTTCMNYMRTRYGL